MRRTAGSLGGEASGEAEIAFQLGRPLMSRTSVLGYGPSVYLGLFTPGEDLGIKHR